MLITTTDILQGLEIEEYICTVGCSGYDSMGEVYDALENSARENGANAIIGLRVNPYSHVFGDTTFLRFIGTGTAVRVAFNKSDEE